MRFLSAILGIFSVLPTAALAQGELNTCPVGTITCWQNTNIVPYILNIVTGSTGVKVAFVGVLVAMLIYYGFQLVLGADNESTVSETRMAYGHAAVGAIAVGGAAMFANTFASAGTVVNAAPTNTILFGVVATIKFLLLTLLVFNLFYQGFRLVISQDESQSEKAKKQFLYGMIGAAIVVLSSSVVDAFTQRNIGFISSNAVGIANFLATIFGGLAVIAMFAAGFMLVISADEQMKERAKKLILQAVVALAIVIGSLALVRTFIFLPL